MTPPHEAQVWAREVHVDEIAIPQEGEALFHPEHDLQELFHDVACSRDAEYFSDGKQVVDSVPKRPLGEIALAHMVESESSDYHPARFWHAHFEVPNYVPPQISGERPGSLDEYIQGMWDALTYHAPANRGTLLGTSKPTLKPGERFGESYYRDLEDGVRGLLAEARTSIDEIGQRRKEDLALGVADNIAEQIEKNGFMPNGLRKYYDGRSQVPVFVRIVKQLSEHFGDRKPNLVEHYLPQIVKEYEWWMRGEARHRFSDQPYAVERVVHLPDNLVLNRHWDNYDSPRPESYQEDMATAARNPKVHPAIIYRNLRAGAESFRDFTLRWFEDPDRLETIHTTDFATPELNARLFEAETFIADAHREAGRTRQEQYYRQLAERRRTAMDTYLWNPAQGCYYDFDFVKFAQSDVKAMGTAYPVASGASSPEQAKQVARVLSHDLLSRHGFRSTLGDSEQQWDGENGFAPDQSEGVQALFVAGASAEAIKAMRRWVRRDEAIFKKFGVLFEKNNVVSREVVPGSGGEYPVQRGFLWSIGVHVEFKQALERLDSPR